MNIGIGMNIKEICNIREWAPLTVIEKIPARIQRGIFPTNLNLTCVDAVAEFLAVGSDAGIVFWYNRHTGDVQKLRAEGTSRITCVKIVDSVEFMVAAGSSTGQVSIFQIQKEVPPDLNLVAPSTRPKPIQRYTIRDLHHTWVSCCEWSKNGMKLYSGDRQGVVVLTEFDYQAQISKSIEVISEAYEIVQLNVHQSYLLVSTLYRTIICQRDAGTGNWQITQVGKKERKQLADCGGIFLKSDNVHKQPLLLCARPGLRFWLADVKGNVEKTILFRDVIAQNPKWEIPILNPKNNYMQPTPAPQSNGDATTAMTNFRNLYLYAGHNSLVVTHDDVNLYLLNLDTLRLEAVARSFRKIVDFCVVNKEIFVLEGERSLLRLAPMPEKPNLTSKVIFNPSMPPPIPALGLITSDTFEAPVEFEPDEQHVISAEECFELPPIEKLNLNIPIELAVESPRAEQSRRLEIFRQISEQDFDAPIVHHSGLVKHTRKKKHGNTEHNQSQNKPTGIVEIAKDVCSKNNSKNDEQKETEQQMQHRRPKTLEFMTKATLMDASFCLPNTSTTTFDYTKHMPDILSPNTLQQAIATKAKTLAEELQLPDVSLAPITAEELKKSQAMAAPPPPPLPPLLTAAATSKISKNKTLELSEAYPRNTQLSVDSNEEQSEASKKIDKCEGDNFGNYSAGQPVDELCSPLALIVAQAEKEYAAVQPPRTFVPTQPQADNEDEITSFLLDFNRARDPLKREQTPPQSADSNTSSEWEFLDN